MANRASYLLRQRDLNALRNYENRVFQERYGATSSTSFGTITTTSITNTITDVDYGTIFGTGTAPIALDYLSSLYEELRGRFETDEESDRMDEGAAGEKSDFNKV